MTPARARTPAQKRRIDPLIALTRAACEYANAWKAHLPWTREPKASEPGYWRTSGRLTVAGKRQEAAALAYGERPRGAK